MTHNRTRVGLATSLRKRQELDVGVTWEQVSAVTLPVATSSAANRLVVPWRT